MDKYLENANTWKLNNTPKYSRLKKKSQKKLLKYLEMEEIEKSVVCRQSMPCRKFTALNVYIRGKIPKSMV